MNEYEREALEQLACLRREVKQMRELQRKMLQSHQKRIALMDRLVREIHRRNALLDKMIEEVCGDDDSDWWKKGGDPP